MGDYLVKENLTPDEGKYPRFPRSTGIRLKFPQPPDCGSQADQPYEIQPDKGGIAAYALVLLYEETQGRALLEPGVADRASARDEHGRRHGPKIAVAVSR